MRDSTNTSIVRYVPSLEDHSTSDERICKILLHDCWPLIAALGGLNHFWVELNQLISQFKQILKLQYNRWVMG